MRVAAILTFDKMSISPGQITADNCKTAFSLHVVDYNFYSLCIVLRILLAWPRLSFCGHMHHHRLS